MSFSVNKLCLFHMLFAMSTGCTWQKATGPSTLVIAVENLAFERVSCESGDLTNREFESFRVFCEEGVRFTHAYTTSTLSQPALASILTGLYPLEHGLRTNGNSGLAAKLSTVAEQASENGYRTALFSGGPPILRKSGLAQGFEVFDDRFDVTESLFFRPALEVAKNFISWVDRDVGKRSYFAVLFLADLQFPNSVTTSDLGEVRERSIESQTREIAESLTTLIAELRRRDLFHRTQVILVGLNGQSTRINETPPLSVFADNTQVALFFKPARRGKDQGPQWTIDKNVSLADLGTSLIELVGGKKSDPPISQLARASILSVAEDISSNWDNDRLILVESSWGDWRGVSGPRYAARRRQYLYVHDQRPKIYNTLIDRLESNPLPSADPLWQTLQTSILNFFDELNLPKWNMTNEDKNQRYALAHQWWMSRGSQPATTEPKLSTQDGQFRRWLAQRYLEWENWNALMELGSEHHDYLYEYVARKNLNMPTLAMSGACTRYFGIGADGQRIKLPVGADIGCEDQALVHLLQWIESDKREFSGDLFTGDFRAEMIQTETSAHNYIRYLPWDVSLDWPIGASYVDLFLALPENRGLLNQLKTRSLRENRTIDL